MSDSDASSHTLVQLKASADTDQQISNRIPMLSFVKISTFLKPLIKFFSCKVT